MKQSNLKMHSKNKFILMIGIAIFFQGCFNFEKKSEPVNLKQYLVGAYYYIWYPRNFKHGNLRRALTPPQIPVLGIYNSSDIKVAEQHIQWCAESGIDFLSVDFWPTRPEQLKIIKESFLKAKNISDIKFSIFFETWAINFNKVTGEIFFNKDTTKYFINNLIAIGNNFFNHPSYLKINNRPVIFLYLTRNFAGDYINAIKQLRCEFKKIGYNPFIVADEIFWKVTNKKIFTNTYYHASNPNINRIKIFDAITSYNMYEGGMLNQRGYGAISSYFKDVFEIFNKYKNFCVANTYFIPNIIPGYNDRGTRPKNNHYAIPRMLTQNSPEGSFFEEGFNRIAFPLIDHNLNMLMITSFNEWNEDTGIEPLAFAPPTKNDLSEAKNYFTTDYLYSGFEKTYLEIIKNKVIAVYGFVLDKSGNPIQNLSVKAYKNNQIISECKTFSNGFYRLSRLNFTEGEYEIKIDNYNNFKKIIINNKQSLHFDINL